MEQIDINKLVRSDLERIVAVEPGFDGTVTLYRRQSDGTVEKLVNTFQPWFLTENREEAEGCDELVTLDGPGYYRYRACFQDYHAYKKAIDNAKSGGDKGIREISDFTQQYLSAYAVRLFSGMQFHELRRMQLDIETRAVGEKHFPDPERPGDEIFMVSLKDNTGWETCITTQDSDEPGLLRKLVKTIQERDPDVIEGHNIFNFDLNYIAVRCKRHKIPFAIGRNDTPPKTRASRLIAGERIIPYTRFDVYGRHIVDTLHLVHLHDAIHRDMDSHGLKYAAKYFNVASPERTYIAGDMISQVFDTDPQKVMDYCMDDVRETDALSRILSPSFFHQTRLVPFSYQSCITRGTAARIEALLCGEYILRNASLPLPCPPAPFQGALTAGEKCGVFNNVWHVDVRSLYPSVIIAEKYAPASDYLGVYPEFLRELRKFRLAAKDAAKTAAPGLREDYQALQGTFKILINSFYGYAGFSQATFNDYEMAAKVTSRGREILQKMRDFLEERQAQIIEMDTDGIYFSPAPEDGDCGRLLSEMQEILPPGIEIDMDASYKAMFGYKSKNYALLGWDGKVSVTGAALKSRGIEPFQRRYIMELLTLVLNGRQDEVQALYEKYAEDIENRSLPLSDFAKREYLSTSLKVYSDKLSKGTGKRSAAFDLAIASGRPYGQGSAVEFYVTGNKKSVVVTNNSKLLEDAVPGERDENVPYYLSKLQQLHSKLTFA